MVLALFWMFRKEWKAKKTASTLLGSHEGEEQMLEKGLERIRCCKVKSCVETSEVEGHSIKKNPSFLQKVKRYH